MWLSFSDLLKNKKFEFNHEDGELPLIWQKTIKTINPILIEHTEYKDIKKDTLYIKVSDSLMITELETYKRKIKEQINKKRKKPINNIKFTLS